MTKLTYEEYMNLIYILKEMAKRIDQYREEAKSTEEYIAYDLFYEKLDNLLDKIDQMRIDQMEETDYSPLPFY